ncbi:MAG: hypothetical protein GY696_09485 [Gammaproteobacteria bacterium]|nr:hypothetical protein [Gammaproteobacteria bacterium]
MVNNGQVRSVDGRLQLPCLARENGCQTVHRTYVQPPVHSVFQQGGLQYILPPHHPSPGRMGSHYAPPSVAASPTAVTGPTTD